MALKERIADEMKAALLGGNRFAGETLRNLKAAILNEEVAQGKRESGLSDEEIEKVIAREVKKRTESAKLYRENDRSDLAEPEEQEIEVLSAYLPAQLGDDELRVVIQQKIAELGADGPQMMGHVIGAVKAAVGNTADGAVIAQLVKQELTK
jgi:uncharacterized protein YqeY